MSIGTVEPTVLERCEDAIIAQAASLPAAIPMQPLGFPVDGHWR